MISKDMMLVNWTAKTSDEIVWHVEMEWWYLCSRESQYK